MTTRKQVEAAAKKAGFKFEVDDMSVFLGCPDGYVMDGGLSYEEWPVGRREEYTKTYCYEECLPLIAGGMEKAEQ